MGNNTLRADKDATNRKTLVLAFCAAVLLTVFGFFGDGLWFWLAYLPFVAAVLQLRSRAWVAVLAAGHFAVVFAIAATGLLHLDFALPLVLLGYLGALAVTALLYGYLGVGMAAVICAIVPYFPGSPLLIAGALFPGWGFAGLALLAAIVTFLELLPSTLWRRTAAVLLANAVIWSVHFDQEATSPPYAALNWRNVPLVKSEQVPPLWALLSTFRMLPEGSSVITGENILQEADEAGLRDLCRAAHVRALDLYVGVQASDGVGELWRINAETCLQPARLYRAAIGIPGLTGDWVSPFGFGVHAAGELPVPASNGAQGVAKHIGFLACFEAFSIQAWMRAASNDPAVFVNFSNDYWTDPLPVARLRAKVARQFGALYSTPVLHTDRDHAILVRSPERDPADAL